MLSQSLIWRKKHGVDKILSEYELPMVAKEYFPGESRSYYLRHQNKPKKFTLASEYFKILVDLYPEDSENYFNLKNLTRRSFFYKLNFSNIFIMMPNF